MLKHMEKMKEEIKKEKIDEEDSKQGNSIYEEQNGISNYNSKS
jgi:hypothetical protein